MFETDRAALVETYRRLAAQSRDAAGDAQRVGWPARWVQLLAFELLTEIADLDGYEVLDVGCGLGDCYAYLRAQGFDGVYRGVDLVPASIEQAQARYPQATFAVADVLAAEVPAADYVFASGLFDVRTPHSADMLRAMLRRLFGLARRGLAWNIFLDPPTPLQYSEPLGALTDFCASLTPHVVVRTDYNLNHATFYLYQREAFYPAASQALVGRLYMEPDVRRQLMERPEQLATAHGLSMRTLSFLMGAAET